MGSKANPAVIGAFVVGAIALAVIGVLIFGSGQFFKKTTRAVCFFSGDTMGLNVGAPVKFKGVEIGSVTDIRLRIPEQIQTVNAEVVAQGIRIPVIIEIDNDKLTAQGSQAGLDPARLNQLIELGLRAQLTSQSLVTGLLLVQLDFRPDAPAIFVLSKESELAEIPTIPTSLQQMQSAAEEIIHKLEDIKFDHFVQSATEATDGIASLTRSPGLRDAIAMLPDTLKNVDSTVAELRQLTTRLDRGQEPLLQSLRGTSERTGVAMEQARVTLENLQTLTAPNAPLAVDLAATLQEVAGAARAMRLLAEYLERHPSSVVRGKPEREK